MILDTFTLSGKVALITGCDTGLGQGMAIALAQAGCDIVGVNRKAPENGQRHHRPGKTFCGYSGRSEPAGKSSVRRGHRRGGDGTN